MSRKRIKSAYTLPELLALAAVLLALAFVLVPRFLTSQCQPRSDRVRCVNNLKNIGLAIRIFETGGFTPGDVFRSNQTKIAASPAAYFMSILSNELSTPKVLLCPADSRRSEPPQNSFSAPTFTDRSISYFASITANENTPNAFLAGDRNLQLAGNPLSSGLFPLLTNTPVSWTKQMHNQQGNIAMGDGSVQQTSNASLQHRVTKQGIATNVLLIP